MAKASSIVVSSLLVCLWLWLEAGKGEERSAADVVRWQWEELNPATYMENVDEHPMMILIITVPCEMSNLERGRLMLVFSEFYTCPGST